MITLTSIIRHLIFHSNHKRCDKLRKEKNSQISAIRSVWRKRKDSNLRDACAPTRFRVVRLQPLGHASTHNSIILSPIFQRKTAKKPATKQLKSISLAKCYRPDYAYANHKDHYLSRSFRIRAETCCEARIRRRYRA